MWLPSTIPYLIALSALFFQWVGERDYAERAAAGEFDAADEPVAALGAAGEALSGATPVEE
jgi:hypothetical protein